MLPSIVILSRPVSMYSLSVVAGILFALVYLKAAGLKRQPAANADVRPACCFGAAGALLGAKLLYLLTVFPEFIADLPFLFSETTLFLQKYLFGGFVFYGGLFGALFSIWSFAKCRKLCFDSLLRILLPVFPLLHSTGRIGCFCTGCCYGIPSDVLGIAFFASEIAPNGIPLFPVQLCESLATLLLFILLAHMSAKGSSGRRMLGIYFTSYGSCRFFLEYLRGDGHRGFIGPLSLSQWLSILVILWGAFLLFRAGKPSAL